MLVGVPVPTVGVAVRRRNAGSVLVAVIVDDGRRVRRIPFGFRTNVGVRLNHAVACGVATTIAARAGVSGIRTITTATGPDTYSCEQA